MRDLPRRELEARVGDPHGLLGPELVVVADGPARGNRRARLTSGTGLQVEVSLDRGCDLLGATWRGTSLAFASAAGDTVPAAVEHRGTGWLRAWPGGLLTTCGLRHVGEPEDTGGEHLGMHGRVTGSPAEQARAWSAWEGDRLVSRVSARLREATAFAEHLAVERTVSVVAGDDTVRLHDVIRNEGFRPELLMVMYHVNLGWPLVDEGTEVSVPAGRTWGLLDGAEQEPPGAVAAVGDPAGDLVVAHEVDPGAGGWAEAAVTGAEAQVAVRWRPEQLPCLTQWRSALPGAYVVGVEPGTCVPRGRAAERAAGRGVLLEPGQTWEVDLELAVSPAG